VTKTAHNATTEKTTTNATPTTASTFHQPQQLLQSTDDDEGIIGDNFPPLPPTMMPTEQTPANTKTTKKTLIVDPFTLRKTLLMTQSTADISDDAEDDILMTQPTTMQLTTTLMTTNTEMTEKTMIDDDPATTSSLYKPHSLLHFTGDIADDTEVDAPMLLPTTLKPTTNDETTMKMKLCILNRSTATDDILSNPPPLMQPTVAFADDVEHEFELLILTTPPTPTFPTLSPDYPSSDSNATDKTTHLSTTMINWVCDNFAHVFKALHRLKIEIVKLTHNVFTATSSINTVYPLMSPTPNQQPHCHQPKILCPST